MVSGLFGSMRGEWDEILDFAVDFNIAVETGMGDYEGLQEKIITKVNTFIEKNDESDSFEGEIEEEVNAYLKLMEEFNIDNSNASDIISTYRAAKDLM